MSGVFSYYQSKLLLTIQNITNWVFSIILIVLSIIEYFYGGAILEITFVFYMQLLANGVYTIVVLMLLRRKRKHIIIDLLSNFFQNHENRKFEKDDELIKCFCLEYRNCKPKEVIRALKVLRHKET